MQALAAGVVIFLVGAGSGWLLSHFVGPVLVQSQATMSVASDASAAYRIFVVEVAHPVEVVAANESHLLQWLSKRLGRSLKAPDLSQFGYRLIGGRLLPGGSGAAAQLMYDDASGKRLTVYVEAGRGSETAFRFKQESDASTFAWIDQGFGFAVTAPADRSELLPIAEAVYHAFGSDTGAGGVRKG
jgi:anti-sigma factor RsiW